MANITKLANELAAEDIGMVVAFEATTDVEHEGLQIGLQGSGAGTLLGYFLMSESRGGYVSLAIEGYNHPIAIAGDDQVIIYDIV